MNWAEFKTAAPGIAEEAEKLFDQKGVLLIGTIRKDGSPRISPVEFLFADTDLYLGMMPRSLKAQDLLRDPRCTLHSVISDKMAAEGEFKLHGRMRNVQDAEERHHYCEELKAKIGWSPEGMEFHLFAIDVESAGLFLSGGDARTIHLWRRGETVKSFKQNILGEMTPL